MSFKSTLSYLGVTANTPPNMIIALKAPTTRDYNYPLGTYWLYRETINPAMSDLYVLVSTEQNQAIWNILSSGSGPTTQFDANVGTAMPLAGIINLIGAHGINTLASGNTITAAIDNSITLGDLSAIPANSNAITLTTGDIGLTTGKVKLPVTSASGGSINIGGSRFLHSYGTSNTFAGDIAGNVTLTTAQDNAGVGTLALSNITTGNDNVAVGSGSLLVLTSGSNNVCIGAGSGSDYTIESNNINISANGNATDSGTIRIGTNATHTSTYIAGIDGVDVGNVAEVVTINADQLGSATLTAGANITITPTANTITISSVDTSGISTLTPDTGGPVSPDMAGNVNTLGTHGINSVGTTNTVTYAINNAITLGDLSAIAPNSNALTLTTGDIGITAGKIKLPATTATAGSIFVNGDRFMHNNGNGTFLGRNAGNFNALSFGTTTGIGAQALMSINGGGSNTAVGSGAMQFSLTPFANVAIGDSALQSILSGTNNAAVGSIAMTIATGNNNSCLGSTALQNMTTGQNNCAVGFAALKNITTGQDNCAMGSGARGSVSGSNNISLGSGAGSALATNESSNILINTTGTVSDNNTLRIGSATGSGSTQLNKAFICGINGVNVGNVASVVSISGDQLGSATLTAGTNITITPTANTITISATADLDYNYTTVNASPYVVLSTDQFISVNLTTIGGAATVQLPDAPTTGRTFTIKDKVGLAATSNITVTTVSGATTIDGATTFVMNTNYQAINVIFGSAGYEVY